MGRLNSSEEISFWEWVAHQYNRLVHRPLYVLGKAWVAILAGLDFLSVFFLLRVRRAEITTLARLGYIVPLSAFGVLLLIALVEMGLIRYVYPTRALRGLATNTTAAAQRSSLPFRCI